MTTYASLYLSESRRLGTRSNPLFLQSKRLLLISHFLETWSPSAGEWRRQTTSKTTNANIVNTLIKEQPHGMTSDTFYYDVTRCHAFFCYCVQDIICSALLKFPCIEQVTVHRLKRAVPQNFSLQSLWCNCSALLCSSHPPQVFFGTGLRPSSVGDFAKLWSILTCRSSQLETLLSTTGGQHEKKGTRNEEPYQNISQKFQKAKSTIYWGWGIAITVEPAVQRFPCKRAWKWGVWVMINSDSSELKQIVWGNILPNAYFSEFKCSVVPALAI